MTLLSTQGYDLEVVADHINPERQGWRRETTVKWGGHKIRATVDRDSYDFQSRIFVEVWSPAELKWNRVRSLAGTDHKDLPYSGSTDKPLIFEGTSDLVEELIAYAIEVLK